MKLLRSLRRVGALVGLLGLANCAEPEVVAELRSLSGSEDAVFLCRDEAGVGHPYSDCPDRNSADDADAAKRLSVFALVTQTLTDEVAVVNVTAGSVVDVDPARPGFGFLRVGGRPISMAATPGGRATFVATADVGRNGIFALPTSCLGAPKPGETERDLTSWPACRLDETPGELSVLVEPFADAPPAASSQATLAAELCRVDSYTDEGDADAGHAADSAFENNGCQGDLRDEGGGDGRRKLLVALPDSGELGVIDAQELLSTPAGTFPPCHFEQRLKLQVDVPAGVAQRLPADLTGNLLEPGTSCSEVAAPTAPPEAKRSPQPAGFALADNRLYVADQAAPVIHVLDTSSVCGMAELSPLVPLSLRQPTRVVTTSRVAVSPLTPAGQRFAYAIDAEDQPGASVMVFDVSPGATDRTPIVRPGSPELSNEAPDRLRLGSAAKDVTFAYRDIPYVDPSTGVAEFGTRCSPDLSEDRATPPGLARSSIAEARGARPGLLRGLFGFILLANGQIHVVDVDDFDADCRRPISINQSSVPDFRGCANDEPSEKLLELSAAADPPSEPFFTLDGLVSGQPLATNEVSCRVVEPHRFRGSRFALNDTTFGVNAPSLREAPQLSVPPSASDSAFSDRPRLLAVPFASATGGELAADVFIGATRFSTSEQAGADLVTTDPNDKSSEAAQTQQSVVLPPLQPRSYAADDRVTVTYEGSFAGDRTAGFLATTDEGVRVLKDSSLSFCGAGVYDVPTMKGYAQRELGVADEAAADQFALAHADFIQLTTALPLASDSYWRKAPVKHADCLATFGAEDAEPLAKTRDFRVDAAFADHLELTAREPDKGSGDWSFVKACFPTAQTYRLRAGKHWVLRHDALGFRHDVVASGDASQCVRSCNPLHKWSKGRVFEISSVNTPGHCKAAGAPGDPLDLRVGCATEEDVACVYDQGTVPDGMSSSSSRLTLNDSAAACIFNGLNARFALYRGRLASVRDSAFTWQTTGGFVPLAMSLSTSAVVSPQSIQFLQQPEQMAVVDGASRGLSLLSLDSFSVVTPSPFF